MAYLTLRSPAGKLVSKKLVPADGNGTIDYLVPADGNYFVAVSLYTGGHTDYYELTAARR